jgi:hypothetical protein
MPISIGWSAFSLAISRINGDPMRAANDDSAAQSETRTRVCIDLMMRAKTPLAPHELDGWKREAASIMAAWASEDGFVVADVFAGRCPPGSPHAHLLATVIRSALVCHSEEGLRLVADGVDEVCRKQEYPGGRDAALKTLRGRFTAALAGQPDAAGLEVKNIVELMVGHVLAGVAERDAILLEDLRRRAREAGASDEELDRG